MNTASLNARGACKPMLLTVSNDSESVGSISADGRRAAARLPNQSVQAARARGAHSRAVTYDFPCGWTAMRACVTQPAAMQRASVNAPFWYRGGLYAELPPAWQTAKDDPWYVAALEQQKLWDPQQIFCFWTTPALALWAINAVALVGHVGIAVAVLVEGVPHHENLDFPLYNIEATWHNISADGFTYDIQPSTFGKLNLVAVCAAFSLLSATAHFVIVATTWHPQAGKWYWRSLGRCRMTHRWIEYTLSAPLMAVALLLIGGIREVTIMFLVFFGQATCMTAGYLIENGAVPVYDTDGSWQPAKFMQRIAPFWTGCLAMFPAWAAFIYAFYTNVERAKQDRDVQPPSWVYSIIWAQVGLFSSFTVPIFVYQTRSPRHYWRTELWYSVLSLVAKLVLNGVCIGYSNPIFLQSRLSPRVLHS